MEDASRHSAPERSVCGGAEARPAHYDMVSTYDVDFYTELNRFTDAAPILFRTMQV